MKKSNYTVFIYSCLFFALFVSFILYFILIAVNQKVNFETLLIVFFICFVGSFLFFYFLYQKIIYSRIESTINHLRKFNLKKVPDQQHDYTHDAADPIEQLNQEIVKIADDRQKEIEHLTNLETYRKEYLGNVSHELKTPIFNIQGYISTLIDGGLYDEAINLEYLKKADRSVDRMIHIIDDLETISQLESGSLILEKEKFDIIALTKDVIDQLELNASKKEIKLTLSEGAKKSIKVIADKFRIRQVLVNLITNSIKYGKNKGSSTVGFSVVEEQVIIEISDNGIGIESHHLPRLFERFYRVDKGRSREQGGTGLGLSIVKHILEAHEQAIEVESKVGEGTTFRFTLSKI